MLCDARCGAATIRPSDAACEQPQSACETRRPLVRQSLQHSASRRGVLRTRNDHTGISQRVCRRRGAQQCRALPLSAVQHLQGPQQVLGELAEGLEAPVQLLYLVTVLGFLVVGAFLVVRQVLVRRELEEAAKTLGEKVRSEAASADDCFELGVILLRKKLFTQATKNLERAVKLWDRDPTELAQVYNALGYAYSQMGRLKDGVQRYRRAVELQPGYIIAWNNLGDVQEKAKNWQAALDAYREVLSYDPSNDVASSRVKYLEQQQLSPAE